MGEKKKGKIKSKRKTGKRRKTGGNGGKVVIR
jgi:hypothetical protein